MEVRGRDERKKGITEVLRIPNRKARTVSSYPIQSTGSVSCFLFYLVISVYICVYMHNIYTTCV
jgi:hypothetical protein